jgi:NNP family nitrate/nitrite transporter-like MFS transporter
MATASSTNQNATPPAGESASFKGVMPVVLFLTAIFLINFTSRQFLGPLLPVMEKELDFSHSQTGFILLLSGITAAISQVAASPLAARLGYHKVITISFFGSALANVSIGLSTNYWTLCAACALHVLLAGLYITSAISLITLLTERRHWGKAMGIHEFAPNLGLILAPFIAAWFLEFHGWRTGYFVLASVLGAAGLVFLIAGPGRGYRSDPPNFNQAGVILRRMTFWLLCAMTTAAICIEIGIYNLLPLFLVNERGYELTDANYLVGMSRLPALGMVLAAGWITDRLGQKRSLALFLGFTGLCLTYLGVADDSLLAPIIVMQASAAACIFPPYWPGSRPCRGQMKGCLPWGWSWAFRL